MSLENSPRPFLSVEQYVDVWRQSVTQVIEQSTGASVSAEMEVGRAAEAPPPESRESVWINFALARRLKGEQGFSLSIADACRFASFLLGDAVAEEPELTEERRDALGELFRQFAGTAALALKNRLGEEVEIQLLGLQRPVWTPAAVAALRLTSPRFDRMSLAFWGSSELIASLSPSPELPVPPPAPPVTPGPASSDGASREVNLDLLMDIELDASLRFGERVMTLQDILDLGAGAVVELNRQISEPVELLVGGKVIARGEVVVVDGNYGIRVTEMASAQERIESLRL